MYLFECYLFQKNFLTAHQPIPCLSLNLVFFANLSKFQSVQKDLLFVLSLSAVYFFRLLAARSEETTVPLADEEEASLLSAIFVLHEKCA